MIVVRSPLRISFGGGGTDLPAYYEQFGGAVLSTTINKHFYIVLNERSDGRLQVVSSNSRFFETSSEIVAMDLRNCDLEIPLTVLREMDDEFAIDLFITSEIPLWSGLGSSASLCTGVLMALSTYLNQPLSKYKLAERAFHLLRDALKRRVGRQDEFATAFGGLNYITFRQDGHTEVKPLHLPPTTLHQLQSSLMLFRTGCPCDGAIILEDQERSIRNNAGGTLEALDSVHILADRMRASLESGNLDCFGVLLDESWRRKKRISAGFANRRIDHVYDVALQHGALGGKITGAGGGGLLLLYCPPNRREQVRKALNLEGVKDVAFKFETKGAKVLVNEPSIREARLPILDRQVSMSSVPCHSIQSS